MSHLDLRSRVQSKTMNKKTINSPAALPLLEEATTSLRTCAVTDSVSALTPCACAVLVMGHNHAPALDGLEFALSWIYGLWKKYVRIYKCRMLTHASLLRLVCQGDWFTSVDLKDAYFHIPIYLLHRKYLRSVFLSVCYEYRVLPFGLSLSPRVLRCGVLWWQ